MLGLGPGGGNVDNNTGEINVPVGDDGTAILTEAVRRLDAEGIKLADVALRRPTLDDVFLALTGHAAEQAESGEPAAEEDGGKKRQARAEAREGMSAVTETFRQPGKLGATVSDWWVIT